MLKAKIFSSIKNEVLKARDQETNKIKLTLPKVGIALGSNLKLKSLKGGSMRFQKQKAVFLLVMLFLSSFLTFAQEKTKAKTGEEMEIVGLGFEKKKLAGAEIIKATVISRGSNLTSSGPAEKTQFDVILKSRIITNKEGEFTIDIPDGQFQKITQAAAFELVLKVKPPKDQALIYQSDQAKIKLKKQDGPVYRLILFWVPDSTKTNKGTFAVSSKAQT